MNKTQEKKCFSKINFEKFLIIYILLQPIIDVATSLCVRFVNPYFTIGILIRSLFLVFTLIYSFAIANKKWRKIIFIYCLTLLLYIILFFANNTLNIGFTSIVSQFKSIIKIFYFSILLIAFVPIMNKIYLDNKYLIYSLFGYTAILCITTFCGIAFDSYADGSGHGKNGLFYAANEIGTILCILMPFLFLNLINTKSIKSSKQSSKQKIIELITLVFVIISALWMGTKVPFLGLILSLLVVFGVCIINIIKKKNIKSYLYKITGIILLFFIIFSVISYSPIGKNLGISINKIIKISKTDNTENNVPDKSSSTQSNIETVVLSSRDIYYDNTLDEYKNSSLSSKILGIGYLSNENGQISQRKNIEIDYFDILFSNGIVGFIIFFIPVFGLLLYIATLLWKKKNMLFKNDVMFYIYSIFIAFVIAGLAGHVLTAPAVSFYLALTINQLINILKSKEEK